MAVTPVNLPIRSFNLIINLCITIVELANIPNIPSNILKALINNKKNKIVIKILKLFKDKQLSIKENFKIVNWTLESKNTMGNKIKIDINNFR